MDYPQEHIKPYGNDGKKSEQVEEMFDNIAPAYDKLNHTLSMGIDRSWRKKAIDTLRPFSPRRIMDVATGTGDFAILACRELQPDMLIGTDISEGMMNVGREKVKQAHLSDRISFAREDCTSLSFADESFDAVTVAFGIRNFDGLDKGLSEMCRVLVPGGHLVILELSTPDRFPMKQLFTVYSKAVIPLLGKFISKDNSAYTYLPQSIRAFPQGEIMQGVIRKAGFSEVRFKRLTFGICTFLHGIGNYSRNGFLRLILLCVTHPGIAHESDQKEYDSISHFNLSSNPINCSNSSSVAKGIVILPFPFSLQVNWTFVLK